MAQQGKLTVSALIAKLESLPQNMFVEIEGCDCIGFACDAKIFKHTYTDKIPTVLIERLEETK